MRDETLDAKPFFAPGEKAQFGRQQYGFSLGGPIKRNKSFLFGDLELTDIRESSTFVSTVPTPAMRNGDFNDLGQTMYDRSPTDKRSAPRTAKPSPTTRFR